MRSKNKVIHALTILVFTLLMSGTTKADNEMIPLVDVFDLADVTDLADVFNKEQNPTTLVYAFQRCSGLFGSLYASFNNYQIDQLQQMAATQLEAASLMNLGAQFMAEQTGLNLTVNQLTRTTTSIADRYHDIITDAYERTGNPISDFMVDDLEICTAMVKRIQQ